MEGNFLELSDKIDLSSQVSAIVSAVQEGFEDPIKVKVMSNKLKKACDAIEKGIEENVLNEADKYNGNSFDYMGCKVQVSERKTYDFSGCSVWSNYSKEIADITEARKKVETQLKSASADSPYVDVETGETITSIPTYTKRVITIK